MKSNGGKKIKITIVGTLVTGAVNHIPNLTRCVGKKFAGSKSESVPIGPTKMCLSTNDAANAKQSHNPLRSALFSSDVG